MFPPGRKLAQLHTLILAPTDGAVFITSKYLEAIVCCCPALRHLGLECCRLDEEADLHPLLLLPKLTELHMPPCHRSIMPDSAAGVLSQLTQLSHLQLPRGYDSVGLLQLTVLARLTTLHFIKGEHMAHSCQSGKSCYHFADVPPPSYLCRNQWHVAGMLC